MPNNTLTASQGFQAVGLHCGIKKSGKKDLALLYCPTGATPAAVFTTNKVVSPAVLMSKKHLKSNKIHGIIINSGNANACTGKRGFANAIWMCKEAARHFDVDAHQILVASTGIIGHQLPMRALREGIDKGTRALSESARAGKDFAEAIMTTDTRTKQSVCRFKLGRKEVTIAGTIKGAGMIGPNMATTICVLTTDIDISKSLLQQALRTAIGNSLNKLTVDGHQSTNDSAFLLASGLAENAKIKTRGAAYRKFERALTDTCRDLAKQMALDAEGATKMFTVLVKGAASQKDAATAARAVADYDLVKCAIHGNDPNWGRIICAVGSCGVKLDPDKLLCKIGDISVFRKGEPTKFDVRKVSRIISKKEHTITIDLGVGRCSDFCYGCDLSREYVTINADYHT